MPTVAVVGALDTKGVELGFVAERIRREGVSTLVIDTGVLGEPSFPPDIARERVARAGGHELTDLRAEQDRGRSIEVMTAGAAAVVRSLHDEGRIDGVISLGGSAGTSVGTAAMRALSVGVPKLMVSTMASGDTTPYVGTRDITMMYSVVDIAGINRLSAAILRNAAAAIAGMVRAEPVDVRDERPIIGATMFGVTTPCVTRAMQRLEEAGYEVLVFHATGSGGRAMEDLVEDGYITAVLDITTTELADELVGGVLSAGPQRLEPIGAAGVPHVVAPGALDMVNWGPLDTVPESSGTGTSTCTIQRLPSCARRSRRTPSSAGSWRRSSIEQQGPPLSWSRWGAFRRSTPTVSRSTTPRPIVRGERPSKRDSTRRWRSSSSTRTSTIRRSRIAPSTCSSNECNNRRGGRMAVERRDALDRLRTTVAAGKAIVGCGAGTGLSAKCAEAGGADLIIIYNSGRFRMAGRGSLSGLLPYGDANQIVEDMGGEILPIVKDTPVLAGVCGTDPFRLMNVFIRRLVSQGFSGVQNFPTV
jgi:uncharacterized protein (UPF0261 family)